MILHGFDVSCLILPTSASGSKRYRNLLVEAGTVVRQFKARIAILLHHAVLKHITRNVGGRIVPGDLETGIIPLPGLLQRSTLLVVDVPLDDLLAGTVERIDGIPAIAEYPVAFDRMAERLVVFHGHGPEIEVIVGLLDILAALHA